MQRHSASDNIVPCSGRIVLNCGCGQLLILLGLEEDWRLENRTNFECSCGKSVTLTDRLNEDVLALRQIMRGAFKVPIARVYRH